jgi:hypothetical protein
MTAVGSGADAGSGEEAGSVTVGCSGTSMIFGSLMRRSRSTPGSGEFDGGAARCHHPGRVMTSAPPTPTLDGGVPCALMPNPSLTRHEWRSAWRPAAVRITPGQRESSRRRNRPGDGRCGPPCRRHAPRSSRVPVRGVGVGALSETGAGGNHADVGPATCRWGIGRRKSRIERRLEGSERGVCRRMKSQVTAPHSRTSALQGRGIAPRFFGEDSYFGAAHGVVTTDSIRLGLLVPR